MGLVKDRSHVVGIIPELQGIIAPEHVRPRENAFDEIFHGTQKSGQSRCPSLLLRHVHGVKHGRGHALRGNGTPGSVIHEIGIEPALQEAAHHAAQPHEVDGRAQDDSIRVSELSEHGREVILHGAAAVGRAVHALAGKTAAAAREAEVIEVDEFGFGVFPGVFHAVQGPGKKTGRVAPFAGAAVDGTDFHGFTLMAQRPDLKQGTEKNDGEGHGEIQNDGVHDAGEGPVRSQG